MKGARMKPYDPTICMRCEEGPTQFGSSFCKACDDHFTHPQPAPKAVPAPNNRAKPPSRPGRVNPRG